MESIIQKIIAEIKSGYFFDAHYVISKLVEEYPDNYLSEYLGSSTALYHGHLAQLIKKHEGKMVEQQDGMSWSKHIHNNYSECSQWKRL